MAINSMAWNWGWAYGGSGGTSASIQVNFAPQMAVAQASLSGADGNGLCMGGVSQYRTRASPDGQDEDHDFGWNSNFGYPPVAYDPIMSSVTAQLTVGGNGQQGVMTVLVWLWG
ncbi:MAG TPA: hypothetical protein VFE79_12845 [Paraburkholderia sp.]|nr:hypothetical protein [Paraburkholderia sp.]